MYICSILQKNLLIKFFLILFFESYFLLKLVSLNVNDLFFIEKMPFKYFSQKSAVDQRKLRLLSSRSSVMI